MSEELPHEDIEETPDHELDTGAHSDDLSDDEVIPAARKLPTYEPSGVGDAEEAMQEGANLTVSAKDAERKALEEAMQRFLQSGGKIQQVSADVSAKATSKDEKEE